MLCIVYVLAVGSVLSLVGLLVDYALPKSVARRWLWATTMVASVVVPGAFVFVHRSAHIEIWGHRFLEAPTADVTRDWPLWVAIAKWAPLLPELWFVWSSVLMVLTVGALAGARIGASRQAGQSPRRHVVVDGVPVVVTDHEGPMTTGIWSATVVLPQWVLALPPTERRFVVLHEQEHRKANDTTLLFAMSGFASLFPWMLPLWWQLRRFLVAVESDCDQRVVATVGDAHRYGELLLKVAQASSRYPSFQLGFLPRARMLERRLSRLVDVEPRPARTRYAALAAAAAATVILMSIPHPIAERKPRRAAEPQPSASSHHVSGVEGVGREGP